MDPEKDTEQPFSYNVQTFSTNVTHFCPEVIPEEPAEEDGINKLIHSSPKGNTKRPAQGEETKQTTFLQPSQTDDPQSTADSNTEIPKKTGRYNCASCDYVTPSRTLLRKHAAANHSSEKTAAKAECGQCGYKGRNDVVLRIHYRQMHPDN